MLLNLVLVVLENCHVLHFVLFRVLELGTVLSHEFCLGLLELIVDDDLLQGCDYLIKKYLLRRRDILVTQKLLYARISNSSSF